MRNKINLKTSYEVFLLFFLSLVIVLIPTSLAKGNQEFTGEWENSLLVSPDLLIETIDSSLEMEYSLGDMRLSSISSFDLQRYEYQAFEFDYVLSSMEVDSDISFDPNQKRLNYFKTKTEIPYQDYEIEGTFLLEHVQTPSRYASGAKVEFLGKAPWDGAFKISTLFGMEPEFAESLGLERGSGYTIVNPSSPLFNYQSIDVYLTGFEAGPCKFSVDSGMNSDEGFESLGIESKIQSRNSPISLSMDLQFKLQTKSIELNPQIEFDGTYVELHADFNTPRVDDVLGNKSDDHNQITGLQIEGLEISGVDIAGLTFSGKVALDGNLYRFIGRDDLNMRSGDYVIDPGPDYETLYEATPFSEVYSIKKDRRGSNLGFGLDVYFDSGGGGSLFGVAKITGSLEYRVSDQVVLDYGSIVERDELQAVLLGASYSF